MTKKKIIVTAVLAIVFSAAFGTGMRTLAADRNQSTKEETVTGFGNRQEEDTSDVGIAIPTIRPLSPVPTVRPVTPVPTTPVPTIEPVNPAPTVTPTNPTKNNDYNIPASNESVAMYRLYNPNSGEHFYTANVSEKNHLAAIGWNYEGIGWYAPTSKSGIPVYRLYNRNGGEHHYTTSSTERRNLLRIGWKNEGIGWYSYERPYSDAGLKKQSDAKRYPYSGAVPLYRQYNPHAFANNHNYTTNITENNYLIRLGWRSEGVGWYGVKAGSSVSISRSGDIITLYRQVRNGFSGAFTLYNQPGTVRNGRWFSSKSTINNAWGMLKQMDQNISATLGTSSRAYDNSETETRLWDYNGEKDAIMLSCHELPLYVDVGV